MFKRLLKIIPKSLIIIVCLIQISFLQSSFADIYTPDQTFCESLTSFDILTRNNTNRIKGCKCYYLDTLKSFIPDAIRMQTTAFVTSCEIVNIKSDCVYQIDNSRGYTLDRLKTFDTNQNCQIDTNPEKCAFKLDNEIPLMDTQTKLLRDQEFYGCYGNLDHPVSIAEFTNTENQDVNSFNVFDEEKGLIANSGQRSTLLSLANSQAGPIIGFINSFINYLVSIVFVLCMSSLIYGGYNLIFAGFDSDMTEKGKNAIKYAIAGFLFIMLSYTIVILVQSIF